jgi:hypothetical protein
MKSSKIRTTYARKLARFRETKICLLHLKGFKVHGTLNTAWLSTRLLIGRYALLSIKIKDPSGCSAILAETYCRWAKTLESVSIWV